MTTISRTLLTSVTETFNSGSSYNTKLRISSIELRENLCENDSTLYPNLSFYSENEIAPLIESYNENLYSSDNLSGSETEEETYSPPRIYNYHPEISGEQTDSQTVFCVQSPRSFCSVPTYTGDRIIKQNIVEPSKVQNSITSSQTDTRIKHQKYQIKHKNFFPRTISRGKQNQKLTSVIQTVSRSLLTNTNTATSSSFSQSSSSGTSSTPSVIQSPIILPLNQRPEMSIVHPQVFRNDSDQNAYSWIQRFEGLCAANNWNTDTEKIKHFNAYLDLTPLSWFKNSNFDPQVTTWPTVRDAFLKNFDMTSTNLLNLELQLQRREMKLNESPVNYYQDVLQLCRRIDPNMTEQKKLKELLKGLRPVEAQLVCLLQPANTNEFWEKLQLVTQSLSLAQQRSQNDEHFDRTNERSVAMIEKENINISQHNDKVEETLKSLAELRISMLKDKEEYQKNFKEQLDVLNIMIENNNDQNQTDWSYPQNHNNEYMPNETSDVRPICFHCGRAGHRKRFCHYLRFNMYNRPIDNENCSQPNRANTGDV